MRVSDLIKKLQGMPQDAVVVFAHDSDADALLEDNVRHVDHVTVIGDESEDECDDEGNIVSDAGFVMIGDF